VSLDQTRWLAAFDLVDGSLRWCRTNDQADREIVLAAPSALVLGPLPGRDSGLEIVSPQDGRTLTTATATSFEVLYWPRWAARHDDTRYRRAHLELTPPQETRALFQKRSRAERVGDRTTESRIGSVCDPLVATGPALVSARNTFSFVNRGRAGPPSVPAVDHLLAPGRSRLGVETGGGPPPRGMRASRGISVMTRVDNSVLPHFGPPRTLAV
jgi:hypothetical protein